MNHNPVQASQVAEFLFEAADQFPHRAAVISGTELVSFSELSRRVRFLQKCLFDRGVRPGDGVILAAANGTEFVAGLFSALAGGGPVFPVPATLTACELNAIIEESNFRWLLDDGTLRQQGSWSSGVVLDHNNSRMRLTHLGDAEPCTSVLSDVACVRFTSGTTGRAKGVALTAHSIFERTAAAFEALQLNSDDRIGWVLPMAYHYIASILTYVRYGITTVCINSFSGPGLADALVQHQCSVLYGSPTHYQLLRRAVNQEMAQCIHRAFSTSAATPTQLCDEYRARFGIPLSPLFGIIEVGVPIGNLAGQDSSVGTALFPYEARIADQNLEHTGELQVRGPGMFDAYLCPYVPASDVRTTDGWFATGDLARLNGNSQIEIQGRKKSVINSAGIKIFPEEVEALLSQHPFIEDVRVFGERHPEFGEVVVAEVVAGPESPPEPERLQEELRRFCLRQLSVQKAPKSFYIVTQIPKTSTGKTRRSIG